MGLDAYLLLAVILLTIVAFVREWAPIDLVALASLAALLLLGLVTPQEAVSGFGNEAVVTVMMIFILSDGLVRSGLVTKLAHRLAGISGKTPWPGAILVLIVAGVLSAFINNVAALTIFMPVCLHLAKHFRLSPSKLLLPLSYATIFGGACTLVGTSTNLLISSLAPDFGFEPISMFELAGLGLILFAVGMAYNVLAMRTLPERVKQDGLTSKYRLGKYLTELKVPDGSKFVGRTLMGEEVSRQFQVNVLEIVRGGQRITSELRSLAVQAGDTLIVRGSMEDIVSFKERYGLRLLTETKLRDADFGGKHTALAEVQLAPTSDFVGQTLAKIDFRRRYGCFVLAVSRMGGVIREKVAYVPLQRWDTLLVFGPRERLDAVEQSDDFVPVQEVELHLQLRSDWWIPAITVPAVMILASTGIVSIVEASILGATLLLLTGCLTMPQAYRAINWSVIFLVAAILPMGKAMMSTGLAETIGQSVASFGTALGPIAVLSLIYVTTTVLTEIMSNNSTAVLMVPIAMQVASTMGYEPRPFLMAVAFAASASFLTPMGYKTNAMVYGPGGYRFIDYLKLGTPLKVVFWVLTTLLLPVFFPLVAVG